MKKHIAKIIATRIESYINHSKDIAMNYWKSDEVIEDIQEIILDEEGSEDD